MRKITIGIFIVFLGLILGAIFFGWPEYQKYTNLRFDLASKKVELGDKEKYFSQLSSVSATLKEHNVERSKIDSALPATSIVPDLVNFLAEKSSQNGLILERADVKKISPLDKNSKVQKISLDFTLSGFYPALRNFISSLQKSAKLIEISSIIFSQPQQGNVFSFNLSIDTYSY